MPKISVITVTYNAEKWLKKTILSVLNQTDKNFEYLIVDGNSKDQTVKIIQHYENAIKKGDFQGFSVENFRWISEQDHGLYDAMNKGIEMANGDFIWFINAGDKIYNSHTLSTIQQQYAQNSESDIIYGKALIIDENDKPLGERHKIAPPNLTRSSFLNGLVICHQSILVRKSIAPFYDLQYSITADYDWVIKVVSKSRNNIYINDYLSLFLTAGISSKHRKKALFERYKIMNKHFGFFRTLFAHFSILVKYPFVKDVVNQKT